MSKLMNKFELMTSKFSITDKYRIWFATPIVIILITIIAFSIYAAVGGGFSKGINLGIDFTGGSTITITLGDSIASDEDFVRYSSAFKSLIEDMGIEVSEPQKTGVGSDAAIYLRYRNEDADLQNTNNQIVEAILISYPELEIVEETDISVESIGSRTARTLVSQALIAIIVTWAVVLLYIIIRFELWSGIAAVIGLLHDVLIMICLTIIFHVQINTTFVAAVITIVAYSINNTIIVFDRVREHVKLSPPNNKTNIISNMVDMSVKETLARSIATTITTMITIALLAIIGVSSIQEFALPIIFGLIAGTFSSLFIAPTIYSLIRTSLIKKKFASDYQPAVKGAPVIEKKKNTSLKAKKANKSIKYKK
ncbi:MAG: protein translocase subunit SecF [Clostridia bacterium]|nr:protein translocase subunit SecF [Clostridia bacterium]